MAAPTEGSPRELVALLRAGDRLRDTFELDPGTRTRHLHVLHRRLVPSPRTVHPWLAFAAGAALTGVLLALWTGLRPASFVPAESNASSRQLAGYRVEGSGCEAAIIRTVDTTTLSVSKGCTLRPVVTPSISFVATASGTVADGQGHSRLLTGSWLVRREPSTQPTRVSLPTSSLWIRSGEVAVNLKAHATTIVRRAGDVLVEDATGSRFDLVGDPAVTIDAQGRSIQTSSLDARVPARSEPEAVASSASKVDDPPPAARSSDTPALAPSAHADRDEARHAPSIDAPTAAASTTTRPAATEPSGADEAERLAQLVEDIARLRAARSHEQAAARLEHALRNEPWSHRAQEALDFELGDIRGTLDRAQACEHWRSHRKRFPRSRYAARVEQEQQRLACP